MIAVRTPARVWAWMLCLIGLGLTNFVIFVKAKGPIDSWLLPLFFIIGPWIVLAAFCLRWRSSGGLVAAGALLLGFELLVYHSVFIAPKSSTAAMVYATKPLPTSVALVAARVGDRVGDR